MYVRTYILTKLNVVSIQLYFFRLPLLYGKKNITGNLFAISQSLHMYTQLFSNIHAAFDMRSHCDTSLLDVNSIPNTQTLVENKIPLISNIPS